MTFARNLPLAAAALALSAFASPAVAANVVADSQQIAALLKDKGYKAEIKTDGAGDPYIRTASGGYNFSIFFYGCDKGTQCKSVQFYAAFTPATKPTLQEMNEYAGQNRWGRVYLDKDGDPVIEMDVDLEQGGMSEALFVDNFQYFEAVANKFSEFAFKKR